MTTNLKTSNINSSLNIVMFKTVEGINKLGVSTGEALLTFRQLADHFQVEANSDVLSEELKMQRDVDETRVRNLKKYWSESKGPILPDMTIFVSNLDIKNETSIQDKTIIEACLSPNSDRHICDGQGRTTFIQWLLNQEDAAKYEHYTIAVKIIVTHTKDLSDPFATSIIRQTFADYHVNLKKPTKSISKHFDSSNLFANLLNELLEIEVHNKKLKSMIALHGRIKKGHLWTFDQFGSMIQKFLKVTPATANTYLAKDDKYEQTITLCSTFLTHLISALPVNDLDDANFLEVHEKSMFTKAIFANAMGYLGRSLFDEMVLDETKTWEIFSKLDAPIDSKDDKFWLVNKVTFKDGDSIKIIKATDKRIASIFCRQLRIYPCKELAA